MNPNDIRNQLQDESGNIEDVIQDMENLIGNVGGSVNSAVRESIKHLQEANRALDDALGDLADRSPDDF